MFDGFYSWWFWDSFILLHALILDPFLLISRDYFTNNSNFLKFILSLRDTWVVCSIELTSSLAFLVSFHTIIVCESLGCVNYFFSNLLVREREREVNLFSTYLHIHWLTRVCVLTGIKPATLVSHLTIWPRL